MSKFFYLILFIFSTVNLSSQYEEKLISIYEYFNDKLTERIANNEPMNVIIRSVSRDCVKEKLNMAKNGDKKIDFYFGASLTYVAYQFCAVNIEEVLNEHLNMLQLRIYDDLESELDCLKSRLQLIAPDASIVRGFNATNLNTDCENSCIRLVRKFYSDNDIESLFCAPIKRVDIEKLALKLAIIKFDILDSTLKASEWIDLKKNLLSLLKNKFNCMMNKL